MDAQQALADLTEISSQIQAAVVFDDKGQIAASTLDEGRTGGLAEGAGRLLEQAQGIKGSDGALTQLEAATQEGSVFVVAEGKTRIAATTAPDPTVGLVFYDLKSALRSIATKPAPRKAAPKKPAAKKPAAEKKAAAERKKPSPRPKKPDAP